VTTAFRRWPALRRSSPPSSVAPERSPPASFLNERGWERLCRERPRPRQCDVRRDRDVQRAERERDARGSRRARGGDPRFGRHDAPRPSRSRCPSAAPSKGASIQASSPRLAARFDGPAEVVLADTIGVATPRAVRALVERNARGGLPPAQTRATPATRTASPRSRRARTARRVRRRASAAAPTRPVRRATSRRRTSSTCSKAKASKTGRRPRRAHRSLDVAREPARPEARGDTSTAPAAGRRQSRQHAGAPCGVDPRGGRRRRRLRDVLAPAGGGALQRLAQRPCAAGPARGLVDLNFPDALIALAVLGCDRAVPLPPSPCGRCRCGGAVTRGRRPLESCARAISTRTGSTSCPLSAFCSRSR